MPGIDLIASSVLPLLVAFINLLIAGQAFLGARRDPAMLAMGLSTLGAGIWALAWLVSVFDPGSILELQTLGGVGGALASGGFAFHAVQSSGPASKRRIVSIALAVVLLGSIGLALAIGPHVGRVIGAIARLSALVFVASIAAAQIRPSRSDDPRARRFARLSLGAVAICTAGFAGFALLAMIEERTGVDPLLLIMLVAESIALLYIVERKVDMHIVLSRAVGYAALSTAIGGAAAFVLDRFAGFTVDLRLIAITVGVALVTALIFLTLGDFVSRAVARVLFPGRARLAEALEASRAEAARLRGRLEHVERLAIAGELAASVAHEIKNPLAPIRGYAQLLGNKLDRVSPEERELFEKALRIIREESDRIDKRVADLLQLARGDRAPPSSGRFDLNRVLIEAIAVVEGEPLVRGVVQKLDPSVGEAKGAAEEVRGAIANVLKNAAEAMESVGGGVIEVESVVVGQRAVVIVRDEGAGLSDHDRDQVFEVFYTTKRGGTGLGLAIAKTAVESAGGRITLGPRSDKRGCEVRIELDRSEPRVELDRALPIPEER
jgi:signal transduction histidine kinase